MDLKDYIKVYDDVLTENVCRNAVKLAQKTETERWDQDGRPSFNMINITLEAEKNKNQEWMKVHNDIIVAIKYASERYMLDLDLNDRFPPKNTIEQIRLKHYAPNGIDRFDRHVDVGDHDSARRFLVLFFYLNDVEEGGETEFPTLDLAVKPKQGSCIVFPPTWMYPHQGNMPVSNDKYIVGTYLHYV